MICIMKNDENKYISIKSNSNINLDFIESDMVSYAKRKYSELKSRIKRKNFDKECFTLSEFLVWIMNNKNYKNIYINYINNFKDRNSCPSIDRLNDYETYSFDNIRLVTWKENKDKYNSDRLIGKNTKQSKPVISICIMTGETKLYHSAHYASQQTKITRSSINRSCRSNVDSCKKSRSGMFVWMFQEDYFKNKK